MEDQYYPEATAVLREAIRREFPDAEPKFGDIDTLQHPPDQACYLLWMLDQLQSFQGPKHLGRRARWLAYVQGRAEVMGLITNAANRDSTREDVHSGRE